MPQHAVTEAVNEGLTPQMVLLFLVLFLGVAYWGFSGYRRNKKEQDKNNSDD